MKQLVVLCSILLLASCQKSKNVVADVANSGNANSSATTAKITAKINNRSGVQPPELHLQIQTFI